MDRAVEFNEYIGTLEYDDKSIELGRSSDYQQISHGIKEKSAALHIPIQRTF
jgi:hypothetical protein